MLVGADYDVESSQKWLTNKSYEEFKIESISFKKLTTLY